MSRDRDNSKMVNKHGGCTRHTTLYWSWSLYEDRASMRDATISLSHRKVFADVLFSSCCAILKILNFYFDAGKDCLHSYADSSKNHPTYQDNSVHMGKIVEKITPPTEIPSVHRWDLSNRGNIFSHMNAKINKQTFLRTPRSHWIRRLLFIPSTGTKISHMNRP